MLYASFPPSDSSRPLSLHIIILQSFSLTCHPYTCICISMPHSQPAHLIFIIKLRRNWVKAFPKMLGTWPIMWIKYCVEGVFIVKPNLLTLIALSHPWRSINVLLHPLSTIHHPPSSILHRPSRKLISFPFVYPTKHIQVVYSLVSLSPLRSVSLDLLRLHRDYYSLEPRALCPPTLPIVSPPVN